MTTWAGWTTRSACSCGVGRPCGRTRAAIAWASPTSRPRSRSARTKSFRLGEALRAHEEAWRLEVAANGPTHTETLSERANFAALLARRGDVADGLSHLNAIIAAMPDDPQGKMLPQIWARPWLVQGGGAGRRRRPGRSERRAGSDRPGRYRQPCQERLLPTRAAGSRRARDAWKVATRTRWRWRGARGPQPRSRRLPASPEVGRSTRRWRGCCRSTGIDDAARALIANIDACQVGGIDDTVLRVTALRLWAVDALHRNQFDLARERADAALDRIARSPDRAFYALDEADLQRIAAAALARQGNTREAKERRPRPSRSSRLAKWRRARR